MPDAGAHKPRAMDLLVGSIGAQGLRHTQALLQGAEAPGDGSGP